MNRSHFWVSSARPSSRERGSVAFTFRALALGALVVLAGVACKSSTSTPPPQVSPAMMTNMIGAGSLPGQMMVGVPAFPAYYDAHKDIVVVTDAYPNSAAATYHANYAPSLAAVNSATQPNWYIIQGPAAAGQITVLGSQPGETDYSPLWRTVDVNWKPGVTPTLLTSDNMINSLVSSGKLTATTTSEIVNAAVISVGT